ncbi:MAG TPA: cupredoxin family copper-binding protein [Candidatus Competibacteraceae bacterium]|nr:cupredoxin family copper-binding protein [Candidatus Competibacteraceae bacterium]
MKPYLQALTLGFLILSASVGAEEPSIVIQNYIFSPEKLTVVAGTKVTWVNHDQVPHTVVEKDQQFHSSALDTDDRYSLTFTTPGVYPYFCTLHPTMTGTITVAPEK